MSFFARHLSRLRRTEDGFSLIETVVALGVLFVSLLVLARTAAVGFTDIAMSRQRQQANQLANQVLEQVRGLSYARVGEGLQTSDLAGDSSIITTCPDGAYYLACPSTDPDAEKIVHSENPPDDVPLMPHRRTFDADEGYTSTYTVSVYVTEAKLVPTAGAFRVTAHVSWNPAQRSGVNNFVTTQSLLYTPEGTTDATTGGGTSPFFYGTGSIGRAPVTLTPNPGVAGGTGLQGLSSWDSMTVNLYGLESSLQQQALSRTESKVVLTGASKVVNGVETLAGGDTAEAIADNDPATTPGTSSAPSSLMQSTVTSEISGGGNSVEAEAASGTGVAPCPTPSLSWLTGFEQGVINQSSPLSTTGEVNSGGNVTADSAVKRSGSYSVKLVHPGGSNATWVAGPTGGGSIAVLHFAMRLQSLPASDVWRFSRIDVSGSVFPLEFGYESSTNRFRLTWGGVAGQVESNVAVTAGTWHLIDIRLDPTGATDVADWQVDGIDQPQTTKANSSTLGASTWWMGTIGGTPLDPAYTVNYDDIARSSTASNYPLPDVRVERLLPNGMGSISNAGSMIARSASGTLTAVSSSPNTWNHLDEVPMTSSADYVIEGDNSPAPYPGGSFAEITFENTTHPCIVGVKALAHVGKAGNNVAHARVDVLEGSQVTTLINGNPNNAVNAHFFGVANPLTVATSGGVPWTTDKVNGLTMRFGYTSDANPDLWYHAMQLQYAYVEVGSGGEGDAGTETGSTASTTAAGASTPCGTPTQIDGMACTYAQEDYSTAGPPHLSLKAGVTGSDTLMARLYRFTPSTAPGSISYVWGRRAAGGGGIGTVKETVVRYPGTHTFAPLMPFVGSAPAGWLGYWLKYDAGTSPSTVVAEAGIGSAPPTFASAGTISYWTGAGYASMAPPAAGGDIPLVPVDYTAGGYRSQISGTLGTSPSFTSQVPAGASGTADRNESRATLGAPVTGTFTYKVTYVATSEVVADLTISVDLGALTATARYAP